MEAKFLVLIFIGFVWGNGLRYGPQNQEAEVIVVPDDVDYGGPGDYEVEVDVEDEKVVGAKAADLTMFGETTGCGVNRDCLACANDRHKGCTWFATSGCVRAQTPFQCTANPYTPGEIKEQCISFQDCKTCTTQAGCVFYKGTCTYSAGTNCLEDPFNCINYPNGCPNVPLAVEERMFNGGGYNPVLPPITGPLGHPGPVQYQDISVMMDPYVNPLESQKRFHESNMHAMHGMVGRPPFGPGAVVPPGMYNSARTYSPAVHRPTVLRSQPNYVHQFTPSTTMSFTPAIVTPPSHHTPHITPSYPRTPSVHHSVHSFPASRSYGGSSRISHSSVGGHGGHYNYGHNKGHSYGRRQYGWQT